MHFRCLPVGALLLASASLLVPRATRAQDAAEARRFPYPPTFGLGLPFLNDNNQSLRTIGMGGVGMATPNDQYINDLNPAQLVYQQTLMFDADLTYWSLGRQYRTLLPSAPDSAFTTKRSLSKLRVPTFRAAYPVLPGLVTVELRYHPKRTYDFGTRTLDLRARPADTLTGLVPPPDTLMRVTGGTAGISQATFAAGINLLRTLAAGVQVDYLWGTFTALDTTAFRRGDRDRIRYSALDTLARWRSAGSVRSWRLTGALAHRMNLNSTLNLRSAVSVTWSLPLKATNTTGSFDGAPLSALIPKYNLDSLGRSAANGTTRIPLLVRGGLAVSDEFHWRIGVDGSWQRWSQYRSWNGVTRLADATSLAVGGELTPGGDNDPTYWRRIIYRAGVSYNRGPVEELPRTVTQLGLSLGAGFPVGSPLEDRHSTINVTVRYARLTGGEAYKGNLIEAGLGFTFNTKLYGKMGRGNCPIPSCHVRMKHMHSGVEYTGQPWYKKQNPRIGENIPERPPVERPKSPKRRQKY